MDKRTRSLNNNISFSLLFKGLSVLATLFLVPVTLKYLDKDQYGVWLVLSSIVGWFSFFDIGLGNGLKTKLTESLTDGNVVTAKKYVSTTYILMVLISCFLILAYIFFHYFITWRTVLNTTSISEENLKVVISVVFFSFTIQFVLNVIVTVAAANQNTIIGALVNFAINIITLISIYWLTIVFVKGSLVDVSLPMALIPVFVLFFANVYLYRTKYKNIAPNIKFFDAKLLKEIFDLGWKFFVIQLGLILVYNVDNLIITQLFGPSAVTTYNVSFRYFSVITMISGIVMAPLWTAFSEANRRKDYHWIKITIKKMQLFVLGLFILGIIMAIFAPIVYKLWVGSDLGTPILLSWILATYVVVNAFRTIYIYYLNGVGVIALQVILVISVGVLNIPLGIFLGKVFGLSGVVMATLILSCISGVIEYIQYKKVISSEASGLWNK